MGSDTINNRQHLDAEIGLLIADGRLTTTTLDAISGELFARIDNRPWLSSDGRAYLWSIRDLAAYALDMADLDRRVKALDAVATTPATVVCAACGYSTASYPCVMSADGEGDHEPVTVQSISADDAAFIARYDVHAEQGASEQ